MIALSPDPNVVGPIPLSERIELGFYVLAIAGLLLAWRFEGIGGAVAIVGLAGHYVTFGLSRGDWGLQILLTPGLLLAVPGFLFLLCWVVSRGKGGSLPGGGSGPPKARVNPLESHTQGQGGDADR
jgi:hypothetical protein